MSEDGAHGVTNVAVCRRIGDERSILVCRRCYNEVEGYVSEFYSDEKPVCSQVNLKYRFCPWCSAPLKDECYAEALADIPNFGSPSNMTDDERETLARAVYEAIEKGLAKAGKRETDG